MLHAKFQEYLKIQYFELILEDQYTYDHHYLILTNYCLNFQTQLDSTKKYKVKKLYIVIKTLSVASRSGAKN